MEEVEILCDRVIILDKGKILASGTTDELKELAKIEEKISIEVNDLETKYIALIFWTFAFPIILGSFFNMAFSNIESSEKLDIINIAIIKNDDFNNNEIFKTAFEELSDKNNDDRLFNTKYTTEEEAKKLLEDEEIVGYMKLVNDEPKLTFKTNGINQTIFKYVSEEITQTSNIIKNLAEEEIKKEMIAGNYNIDYEKIYNRVIELMKKIMCDLIMFQIVI